MGAVIDRICTSTEVCTFFGGTELCTSTKNENARRQNLRVRQNLRNRQNLSKIDRSFKAPTEFARRHDILCADRICTVNIQMISTGYDKGIGLRHEVHIRADWQRNRATIIRISGYDKGIGLMTKESGYDRRNRATTKESGYDSKESGYDKGIGLRQRNRATTQLFRNRAYDKVMSELFNWQKPTRLTSDHEGIALRQSS